MKEYWISEKRLFETVLDKYKFHCTSGYRIPVSGIGKFNYYEIKDNTNSVIFEIFSNHLYQTDEEYKFLIKLNEESKIYYNKLRIQKIIKIKNNIIGIK